MNEIDTDYLAELGTRRAARVPATFGEIWSSEWTRSGLDTLAGIGRPLNEATDELAGAIEKHSGTDLASYAATKNVPLGSAVTVDQRIALLGQLADTLPEEKRKEVDPLRDARKRASDKAQAIERTAGDVADATYGLSGVATSFAAGVARQALDPANLVLNVATAPIGGPFKGPALKFIGGQVAGGAIAQAAVEPYIQSARAELGLEAGFKEGAFNIAQAAIGAGGFAGLLRAGAWGLRTAVRGVTGKEIPFLEPDVAAPSDNRILEARIASAREFYARVRGLVSPEDLEAAARVAERDQVLAGTRPGVDQARHIDEAAAALEIGRPVVTVEPIAARYNDDTTRALIRPDGGRLEVRPAIAELGDLVASHDLVGRVNPAYPPELQPRDRAAPASRTWVAEKAAALEPELLGEAPTAGLGAPVIGADGVVESGNGRVMLIARAYDRHPERAAAYRAFLEAQGYNLEGVKHPVLVRVRQGELSLSERARLASEANISPTAGMSTRERALSDAKLLDENLLASYRPGAVTSADNARFVRAFADRVVAPEERPQFVGADDRLSAEGARRIEAALVARAWQIGGRLSSAERQQIVDRLGQLEKEATELAKKKNEAVEKFGAASDEAKQLFDAIDANRKEQVELNRRIKEHARSVSDIVTALYETADPSSKAILGAFADSAATVARLRAAIEEKRLPAEADPTPALLEAFRLVDRARATGLRSADLVDQVDLEHGAVPEPVREAVRLYFRDDALRQAAGRETVAARIEQAVERALEHQNAVADLFGMPATAESALRAGRLAGGELEDMPLFTGAAGLAERATIERSTFLTQRRRLMDAQPFATIDEALAKAPAHQERLVAALEEAAGEARGTVKDPGIKTDRARMEQKVEEKYRGDVRGLTDLVRAGITATSPANAEAIVNHLAKTFRVIDEGWLVNDVGYFDRKLEVIFPDGMMAEVQLWPPEILAAKKQGAVMYERRRAAPPAARAAMAELERDYWKDVMSQVDAAWRDVIGGSPNVSKSSAKVDLASASGSSRASQPTSAELTGRQPSLPTEKAASPDTTATVVPQENQRVAGAAMEPSATNIGVLGDPVKAQEFERVLAELGGDLELTMLDGSKKSALALLEEVRGDARAAAELEACIGEAA